MTNPGKAEGNTSLTNPIYRFARTGEKRKCLPPSLSHIHKFVSGHLNPIHYSDCIKSWVQKLWRAKRQIGCELGLGPASHEFYSHGSPASNWLWCCHRYSTYGRGKEKRNALTRKIIFKLAQGKERIVPRRKISRYEENQPRLKHSSTLNQIIHHFISKHFLLPAFTEWNFQWLEKRQKVQWTKFSRGLGFSSSLLFCLCSRLNNVGATNQGLRASKWCGKNVFFSPRSRHPVDDDLLQLRQLRCPLVQRRVASRALGGFVKFEDPVHLEIVAKFKGRWCGSNGPRINV